MYFGEKLIRIFFGFLAVWSGIGIIAEILWLFYWTTLRDVYPLLPPISKSLFLKNILRATIAGLFEAINVFYFIAKIRKLVRRDSDDQGGRLIYRELIPDPPPPSKTTKPTLR